MRVTLKLTGMLALVIVLAVGAEAWFRVRREMAVFQMDAERDHRFLAETMAASFAHVWRSSGREAALALLRDADEADSRIDVRWAPETDVGGETRGVRVEVQPSSPRILTTTVPTVLDGRTLGWLRVSESLQGQYRYARSAITSVIVLALATALGWIATTWVVGSMVVGRPARRLVDYARRIGEGEYGPLSPLTSRDELGDLSRELDQMAAHIAGARRKLERETELRLQMADQLRHADRLTTVGRLAAGVAHELGTPLNVIQGRAEMIEEGEADDPVQASRIIREQSERIARIVRQLLDFARTRPVDREPCDFGAIARGASELLESIARKRGVTLEVNAPSSGPVGVAAAGPIEQAIINVVVNAIQASPEGGRVEVDVLRTISAPARPAAVASSCIAVRVSDRGPGIRPEDRTRVFDPFFTTKEVGVGTGLGLSVSYGIIDEHDGWIDVAPREGGGSVFTIYLPCSPTDPAPVS